MHTSWLQFCTMKYHKGMDYKPQGKQNYLTNSNFRGGMLRFRKDLRQVHAFTSLCWWHEERVQHTDALRQHGDLQFVLFLEEN